MKKIPFCSFIPFFPVYVLLFYCIPFLNFSPVFNFTIFFFVWIWICVSFKQNIRCFCHEILRNMTSTLFPFTKLTICQDPVLRLSIVCHVTLFMVALLLFLTQQKKKSSYFVWFLFIAVFTYIFCAAAICLIHIPNILLGAVLCFSFIAFSIAYFCVTYS